MTNCRNPHLLILIILIGFFLNCKSEKPKIDIAIKNPVESPIIKTDSEKDEASKVVLNIDSVEQESNHTTEEESPKKNQESSGALEEVKPKEIKKSKKKKRFTKKKPKIKFEELVWNFGKITEGDIIEKKFKFTNIGNAPLEIISTSATCGCTRPSFPFLEILPGESSEIGVSYNSIGKEGVQTPEVTIESNTEPNITTIKLNGIVTPKHNDENSPVLEKDTSKINH